MCYEEGIGVPQNYQEARRLYALAAAQGDADVTEALQRVEEIILQAHMHSPGGINDPVLM